MKKRDQRKLRNSPLTYEWEEPEELKLNITPDALKSTDPVLERRMSRLLQQALREVNADERKEKAAQKRYDRKQMRKLLRQLKHKLGIPKQSYSPFEGG